LQTGANFDSAVQRAAAAAMPPDDDIRGCISMSAQEAEARACHASQPRAGACRRDAAAA